MHGTFCLSAPSVFSHLLSFPHISLPLGPELRAEGSVQPLPWSTGHGAILVGKLRPEGADAILDWFAID
ncbi:MAG: hypothetical protein KDB22_29835, partial [Planctomycetales bacterium]|nr:hypothetical protein [Planctomycetales bacterium]